MSFIDDEATVRQSMRALLRDEALDASPGSAVDGVIVAAMAPVLETVYADIEDVLSRVQLSQIASGDATVDDDFLDAYMAGLGLTRQAAAVAEGYVDFFSTDARTRVIPLDYRLTFGEQEYRVPNRVDVVPLSAGGVASDTRVFIEPAVDAVTGAAYRFRVKVEAVETGPLSVLISGDELDAPSPLQAVVGIRAVTTFSGGTEAETNAEFATRATAGYVDKSFSGSTPANALVSEQFPGASVSMLGVNSPLNLRKSANLFGVTPAGVVDIYAKTGVPTKRVVSYSASLVAGRQFRMVLPASVTAGAYRFNVVSFPTTALTGSFTGSIVVDSVSYAVDSSIAWPPDASAEVDLKYSTIAEVTILFTDTREYTAGGYVVAGPGSTGDYGVELTYMPDLQALADLVYSGDYAPAGVDYLVKAAIPVAVSADVGVSVPSGYNGPDETTLAGVIASYINALPAGSSQIDIFTVGNAVDAVAPSAEVSSVLLTGSALVPSGGSRAIPPTGQRLIVPVDAAERLGPESTFFYTTRSNVTVTFV